MKEASTLFAAALLAMPLATFALVTNTSASAVSTGGGDASAAVQTTVTGGTYRTEVRTEENGVVHTEVQEGNVPIGSRVEIHIATSTPSVRFGERVSAESSERLEGPEFAVSSTTEMQESSNGFDLFFAALWKSFAKIFRVFGWN